MKSPEQCNSRKSRDLKRASQLPVFVQLIWFDYFAIYFLFYLTTLIDIHDLWFTFFFTGLLLTQERPCTLNRPERRMVLSVVSNKDLLETIVYGGAGGVLFEINY